MRIWFFGDYIEFKLKKRKPEEPFFEANIVEEKNE